MLFVSISEVIILNKNFLDWRIKTYSVLLTITRILNRKADTALYLMKLNLLVKKMIQSYGLENVKAVVAHTICFRKLDDSKALFEWAKNSKSVSFENDVVENRNYHELVLQCNSKTVLKMAKQIMLYEVAGRRCDSVCAE